jgi:hypothetical protein
VLVVHAGRPLSALIRTTIGPLPTLLAAYAVPHAVPCPRAASSPGPQEEPQAEPSSAAG